MSTDTKRSKQTQSKYHNEITKNLQKFLEPKTFAVSNHITFADLHLFALLHSKVTQLADNEKNQFNNVYRWFKHIQSLDGVHDYLAKTNRGIARDAHVSV